MYNNDMNQQQWISVVLQNYVKKHSPSQNEIDHIIDFLDNHPNIKLSHKVSYRHIRDKAEEWIAKLNRNKGLLNHPGKTENIFQFKNGFNLVKLKDQAAKDWEGFHLRHCVSTYTNHDGIYSLRDKYNIPHATLEIDPYDKKHIKQIKGFGNGTVNPQYAEMIIEFLNHYGSNLKVSDNQLSNIGYTNISPTAFQFYLNNFKGVKSITFQNQIFIYNHNNWKMKGAFKENKTEYLEYLVTYHNCVEAVKQLIHNGATLSDYYYFNYLQLFKNNQKELMYFLLNSNLNLELDIFIYNAMSFNDKDIISKILLKDQYVFNNNISILNPEINKNGVKLETLEFINTLIPENNFKKNEELFKSIVEQNASSVLNAFENGANANSLNFNGQTIYQIALETKNNEIFKIISSKDEENRNLLNLINQLCGYDFSKYVQNENLVDFIIPYLQPLKMCHLPYDCLLVIQEKLLKNKKFILDDEFFKQIITPYKSTEFVYQVFKESPESFKIHEEFVSQNVDKLSLRLFKELLKTIYFTKKSLENMLDILEEKDFSEKDIIELIKSKLNYEKKQDKRVSDFCRLR
jgi:hypothetical protein